MDSKPGNGTIQETGKGEMSLFNLSKAYLAIGDGYDAIFDGLFLPDKLQECLDQGDWTKIFALVTLFQYTERLSDRKAVDALRKRLDWKYALHIPIHYPGFHPALLCEFRQSVLRSTFGQSEMKKLITRIAHLGLLSRFEEKELETTDLIQQICFMNRTETLYEAISAVLAGLASQQPEWLKENAQAHWYERYRTTSYTSSHLYSLEKQEKLENALAADIVYLLGRLEGVDLNDIPKIHLLQAIYHRFSLAATQGQNFTRPSCALCVYS